jgi:DNA polymerase III alpha subunit (gram-positive type)
MLVFLDLEFFECQILQIGVCRFDENNKEIDFVDKIIYAKNIPERIVKLTGISQQMANSGVCLTNTIKSLRKIGIWSHRSIIFSWGFDYIKLGEDLQKPINGIDMSLVYASLTGEKRPSMVSAAKKLAVPYDENKLHNALYDSRLLSKIFFALKNRFNNE